MNNDKKKILVVADIKNWAFDKIYKNLSKFSQKFIYKPAYTAIDIDGYKLKDHAQFDLVLYLCDYSPAELIEANIPKEKVVMAVRSMVKNDFYNDIKLMKKTTSALLVSNKILLERFKDMHPIVELAPGGIDTTVYAPPSRICPVRKPVVGWAGSYSNMGTRDFRGLRLLGDACKEVGYKFKPALREEKWRNEQEMVEYYQHEIDIYADLSESAGRQNGLLEAASCGKAVIANNVGITAQLIQNGYNGYIVNRDLKDVTTALRNILQNSVVFGNRIRSEIINKWSWEKHIEYFENVFEKVLYER